ncbi:MAG TPA: PhzF family phenazine biosynthesis isomerase, partial [Phototrophicaceae bacterium]|nr:PhzF family phenazine biosynthesis isomerase [Phototrophicaceae bacterium]
MRRLHYHLVDVFTNERFGGNQLAVFTNGRGLPTETMQKIARELNFSETTFVLPPSDPANDWRVRIFTPTAEMPMAGHPTVGTAFVLAQEHLVDISAAQPVIRLEEQVGLIPVTFAFADGQPVMAIMQQLPPQFGP